MNKDPNIKQITHEFIKPSALLNKRDRREKDIMNVFG